MTTTYSSTDVLIVGAGPVGLTLALDLARHGVSCRVIERLSEYPIGTRARGVSARTQEVFADLQVLEPLLAYAEPALPSRHYDQDGRLVRETARPQFSPTPDRPYGNLIISQQHTEMVLRERLATYGLHVELDCALTAFTQNAEYVTAFVQHAGQSEEIRTRYLVGCDGGNSTVRKCANITFLGETMEDRHMLFGNLSVEGIDPHYWHFWTHPSSGLLALNPMPLSDTWFFTAPIEPDEHGLFPTPSLETFQHIFNERVGGGDGIRFYDPVYLSIYRLNVRMVDRFRAGRVFLAGDAAHVHSPAGGQGMNTGIQDAYNLGWKLSSVISGGPDALLDTYQTERLSIVQQVLSSTTARIQAWGQPDTNGKSAGVESMSRALQGKDAFGDITQLSVSYRGSTLAHDLDEATGIRAGDRAPDAICVDAQSQRECRLFDVFTGPHFTLLLFGNRPVPQYLNAYTSHLRIRRVSSNSATSEQDLIDAHGYVYQAYGITDDALVLVRPDGYVGLTGQSADEHTLNAYLRECLG